jgi:short-subunit dehydrogenase
MTHEVLMRVSKAIAQEFPAEATHLLVAAREVRRMELALDEIVAEHRRETRVVEFTGGRKERH